jgi:hypothetical protein
MSEPSNEQNASEPQEGDGQEPKTFDADYVADLRKQAAKYRTEAKANADAAKRLAEIEDAQKSEAEKAADRIAKAEAEVATVPAKVAAALREHLISLHGIDKDDAELFLTANEPELLLKQVDRLAARSTEGKRRNNVVPREGNTSQPKDDPMREFARDLFDRAARD